MLRTVGASNGERVDLRAMTMSDHEGHSISQQVLLGVCVAGIDAMGEAQVSYLVNLTVSRRRDGEVDESECRLPRLTPTQDRGFFVDVARVSVLVVAFDVVDWLTSHDATQARQLVSDRLHLGGKLWCRLSVLVKRDRQKIGEVPVDNESVWFDVFETQQERTPGELSCFVSVCVDADGEKVTVRNAAYGNGLQLGAAFSDTMKAAGFNEFDVVLD